MRNNSSGPPVFVKSSLPIQVTDDAFEHPPDRIEVESGY